MPIQAQATLDVTGRMLLGTDIRAVTATLDALPIDVIGLNCSTGPVAHARRDALSRRELAVLRQRDPECRACRSWDRKAKRSIPRRPKRWRANWARSCATSASMRSADAAARRPRTFAAFRRRRTLDGGGRNPEPKPLQCAASAMTATALARTAARCSIGERINAQGSRKIKRLLLADDYDEHLARRARTGRGRRARARRLHRAHRAHRRRRADGDARQEARADRSRRRS